MDCEIPAEVATSTGFHRENSLRQFNYSQILGVPTAVGMVPVVYRILLGPAHGYRGIAHYGGTFTGLCEILPEYRHDLDCTTKTVYKFDALERYYKNDVDNPDAETPVEGKDETSFKRKKGFEIIELPFHRTYYNGALYYRADYLASNCSNSMCCYRYPADNDGDSETFVAPEAHAKVYPKQQRISHKSGKKRTGCGCGRK